MDPHCNSPCPIALLLVAFAFVWKTKLLKFWGSVLPPILPEDQVDQIFGVGTGPFEGATRTGSNDQIVRVRTGPAGEPT